ncbi:MAG: hypothetical protein QOD99_143 [Chthoniobacter sp.]|jgi:hypothetical protein|nr:hypothetical protein [Chthoniobacter sp.]
MKIPLLFSVGVLGFSMVFSGCTSVSPGDKSVGGPVAPHSALCRLKDENGQVIPPNFAGTIGVTQRGHAATHVVLLQKVQTASCEKFDRVVFTFEGFHHPSYKLEYVDKPIRQCASGEVIPISGDGWLQVAFHIAQAHTDDGQVTIANRNRHLNYRNLKQLAQTCDFEGDVRWVLGVGSPNRYRVVELQDPARLVIDVKH